MKFTCETKALTEAMAIAGRVIPQKSPWPILINIKMVTNDDRVTMIGSDGDTTFEVDVPASVEIEGAACLAFATFDKFVRAAKATQVSIEMDAEKALVKSGRGRITLMGGPVDDYPVYRPAEGDPVTVDAKTFCQALRFCASATATEEVRYYLQGVFFDEADADLNIWGTNGHIASRAVLSDIKTVGGGGILSNEAVKILLSAAVKSETLEFNIHDKGWSAQVKGMRIWGKVIDGDFPDMRRMLSQFKEWSDAATIELDQMQAGLSVGLVGSQDTGRTGANKIILKSIGDDAMAFKGGSPAIGVSAAGRAEVDASIITEFAMALNARYLTAALTGVDADSKLLIRSSDGGLQVEPSQSSVTAKMTSVIMPMRASKEELADV